MKGSCEVIAASFSPLEWTSKLPTLFLRVKSADPKKAHIPLNR
jgi:hypothetical protein